MRKFSAFAVLCLSLTAVVHAQDAVPGEILTRTWMIKNNAVNKYGTGFAVEHKGKAYLVTARHMVEGLPTTKASIDVWQGNVWKSLQAISILFPASKDVDIAVLKTDLNVDRPYEITSDDTGGGVMMGQQVWFLGYPYEIGTQFATSSPMVDWRAPFIKRGTMSAIDAHDPNAAVVIYIDGFNNPGFSGGPVVYWDFQLRKYKVVGVVQGYREDTAKVVVNGQHIDTQFLVNSGILIAYSIKHADEAIAADDKQQQ